MEKYDEYFSDVNYYARCMAAHTTDPLMINKGIYTRQLRIK